MATPKNWRIPTQAEDWFGNQEKRMMHEERRPRVHKASDLLGPGIAPNAVRINDWNGEETFFNGFYYSGPGSMHSPDDSQWWIGESLSELDGYGIQKVWNYRLGGQPTLMVRTFTLQADTRLFSPWQALEAGSSDVPGDEWFIGSLDPDPALGEVGDFYLKSDGNYYEKTSETAWTHRGSLRGPQGIQGPKGDQGDVGPQGPEGPMGPQGATGPEGPEGPTGPEGPEGPQGPPGPANSLSIGTVTTSSPGSPAAASITGTAPVQTLNLTIPRGEQGPQGVQGEEGPAGPANDLNIGTVTTGAAGSAADASITGTAPSQTLNLTIPTGPQGPEGPQGAQGPEGPEGPQGPQGDPGPEGPEGPQGPAGPPNTLSIGTVSTGSSGSPAGASITGTSPNQTLNLTLPRGPQGIQGPEGPRGPEGPEGDQGPPGVVAGNLTYVRAGTIDVQGESNGNYWVDHGGPGTPTGVQLTLNTEHGGGAEDWHCSVSDLLTSAFMVHINSSTGANVGSLVRLHWMAFWT